MIEVLFLGGPDHRKIKLITAAPVHQGALLQTFLDRPMSVDTAVAIDRGDFSRAIAHRAFDRFDYRIVQFRCGDSDRFVAIDNALPDEAALQMLFDVAGDRQR